MYGQINTELVHQLENLWELSGKEDMKVWERAKDDLERKSQKSEYSNLDECH